MTNLNQTKQKEAKNNKKGLLLLFLVIPLVVFSQSPQQIAEDIKSNRNQYLCGEGNGSSIEEADRQALFMLVSQITLSVEATMQDTSEWGTGTAAKEKIQSVIKTYSSATLHSAERLTLADEPNAKVFRYIERQKVSEMFDARKTKIHEFVTLSENKEAEGKISDALRYNYWALLLLKSHPNQMAMTYRQNNGTETLYSVHIPNQITNLLSNIRFQVTANAIDGTRQNVALLIEYKDKDKDKDTPVENIDFSYFTGRDWTNPHTAIDGIGAMKFTIVGNAPKQSADVKIEYKFKDRVSMDKEVEMVMNAVSPISFTNNAKFTILFNQQTTHSDAVVAQEVADLQNVVQSTNLTAYKMPPVAIRPYVASLGKILTLLKNRNYGALQSLCTPNGYSIATKLLKNGNVTVLPLQQEMTGFKIENQVKIAPVPMSFSFKSNNNKTFTEKVVFYFNENNKLSNLAFALSKKSTSDILAKESWAEFSKMTMINFLEHYKTAYALKRFEYVKSIFAEDAIIIVGRVVKVNPNPEFNRFQSNEIVKLNKYTKTQYMSNLSNVFNSNEYINIRFEDLRIRKSGVNEQIFGVQIKQNYYSSHYGDTGYLFLMVDLSDTNNPLIQVRTWQPEKNADGSLYGAEDF